MKIRRFVESDAESVVALWTACGLTRPWNDPKKDIERKLAVQRELFLVCEEGGAVIGTAMGGYEGHRGWVNYLAVHPDHRRRGYGLALIRRLERELLALGCPKLSAQVRSSNDAGRKFYERIGYAQDDVACYGTRLIRDEPSG